MPAARKYPREGPWLILAEQHPIIDKIRMLTSTPENIQSAYDRLADLKRTALEWWLVETGIRLVMLPRGAGGTIAWCVPDNVSATSRYRWLSGKAHRYIRLIERRINSEYSIPAELSEIAGPATGEGLSDMPEDAES